MLYRRPISYVPPYNYCDRLCRRCTIDKTKCLLYQTEMDDHLYREMEGKGEPTPEETADRILKNAETALRMVQDQAKALGLAEESEPESERTVEAPSRPEDELVDASRVVANAIAAFLRSQGPSFPRAAEILRHYFVLVTPKLGRATMEVADEHGRADTILQAQVAHKALVKMGEALEQIRREKPSLGDEMIELMALLQTMAREVEKRWLAAPCELLEPAAAGEWWGPLRDITDTLKHFRR